MAKSKSPGIWSRIGVWSFVAGLIVAMFVSLFSEAPLSQFSIGVLAILGLVVGLLNVADGEVKLYLIGAIAFIIAAGEMSRIFASLGVAFTQLQMFMDAVIIFTAPGALIVSLKALYEVAKDA